MAMKTGEHTFNKCFVIIFFCPFPSFDPAGPRGHHQHHGGPLPLDQDVQDEQGGKDGAPGHPSPEGHG